MGTSLDQEQVVEQVISAGLLGEGAAHQLAGRLVEAEECYALALDHSAAVNNGAVMAEALRRLGILHHLQGGTENGVHYCERSRDVALGLSLGVLAAEATMAMANMACDQGRMAEARELFSVALELSASHPDVAARIEHNLGIVESIQGNLAAALEHYDRALAACEQSQDILGRARALHNIGMICSDRKEWSAAHHAFDRAASLARQGGDYQLQGLCLLNHADIDLAHHRYEDVRRQAEAALAIFNRLGARVDLAAAFRMLGIAYRFLERPALAESRLRSALEIASAANVPLTEAESCRDIALLLAEEGRPFEALGFLDRSLVLFRKIGATLDVAQVSQERTRLMAA